MKQLGRARLVCKQRVYSNHAESILESKNAFFAPEKTRLSL